MRSVREGIAITKGVIDLLFPLRMHAFPKVPPRLCPIFANNPVYFVTACTYRRKPLLATSTVHTAFVQFSEHAYTARTVAVGRYVIMPDHVHLFVSGPDDFDLGRWMGILKRYLEKHVDAVAARRLTSPRGRPLQKTRSTHAPVWQRGFFDHVLRSEESYGQKWNYVRENPVRAGLIEKPEDWPFAGEIITIDRI
jgi:putative transposase